jgi:hypothetical protein
LGSRNRDRNDPGPWIPQDLSALVTGLMPYWFNVPLGGNTSTGSVIYSVFFSS